MALMRCVDDEVCESVGVDGVGRGFWACVRPKKKNNGGGAGMG